MRSIFLLLRFGRGSLRLFVVNYITLDFPCTAKILDNRRVPTARLVHHLNLFADWNLEGVDLLLGLLLELCWLWRTIVDPVAYLLIWRVCLALLRKFREDVDVTNLDLLASLGVEWSTKGREYILSLLSLRA